MAAYNLLGGHIRIELSDLNYPFIHVHIVSNSHLGGLRGYGGLQLASEVTSDLGMELSDFDYLCSYGFVASISNNSIKFTGRRRRPIMTH